MLTLFFSRDIAEFWRRWHISLTTWIRDYLFVPLMLAGKRDSKWLLTRSTFIMFIATGLWHGANWTFIFFGLYMATCINLSNYFFPNQRNKNVVAYNKVLPNFKEVLQMSSTFSLVVISTIFFRSESIKKSFSYIYRIFNKSFFTLPVSEGNNGLYLCLVIMLVFEWLNRSNEHGLQIASLPTTSGRWVIYFFVLALIFMFGGKSESFVYFQF